MPKKINIKQYIKEQKKFPVISNTTSLDKIKLYTKPKKIKVFGKDTTGELDIDDLDIDDLDMDDLDIDDLDMCELDRCEHIQLPADVASLKDLEDYIDSFNGKESDKDDIEKLDKKDKKNHSFQSVSGSAEGVHFDSKWEYAYYVYVKNIQGGSIERNTDDYFYYIDAAGKRRKFYYDFVVNGCPHEVKGIFRANDVLKMEQCPQVTFIYGEEMKRIIKEVKKEFPEWDKAFIAD